MFFSLDTATDIVNYYAYNKEKLEEGSSLFSEIKNSIKEKSFGLDHLEVTASLDNLAMLYETLDDYTKAEPLYKRSLAIKEKSLGPNHPNVATSLKNLANVYKSMKRIEEAEELEQRAVQIRTMKR